MCLFLPKSSAKVSDNITTIQQIKICSIDLHGTLTKAEQAELLVIANRAKGRAANPPGPPQLAHLSPPPTTFTPPNHRPALTMIHCLLTTRIEIPILTPEN
jgi:hypothetical protein